MCSTCTSTTINCSLNFSYGSRKLCAVCLTQNFANFHSTTQDKFMRNASSKRDATCHDTHTHTHTWGTPHTIYLPQVASYVPNKRSCHCSGLPRPHSHLPHTPHFATVYRVQKNELSLSKSWNLIRQPTAEKRIIHFWSSRLSAGEVLRLQPNEIGWQRQMQIIASCYSRQRPLQRPVTS